MIERSSTTADTLLGSIKFAVVALSRRALDDLPQDFLSGESPKNRSELASEWHPSDHLKFLSEAAIAYASANERAESEILDLAIARLFSEESKRFVACFPHAARHLISTLAYLPPKRRPPEWTRILKRLTRRFPQIAGDEVRYRAEELQTARRILGDAFQPRIDLSEFPLNGPWLDREQVYAFTHRLFYITDYCQRQLNQPAKYLLHFIEDAAVAAYLRKDLDVLLELTLCYSTIPAADPFAATFFERLAHRLYLRDGDMQAARVSVLVKEGIGSIFCRPLAVR